MNAWFPGIFTDFASRWHKCGFSFPAMNPAQGDRHKDFWIRQAAGVRRRVNLAWWIECLSAPLLVGSLVGAGALLLARREIPSLETPVVAAITAGTLLVLGLACLGIARRRFESTAESLVRIEASMRLRNALSAATAGVAPWPEPVKTVDAGIQWRWPRLLVPVLGSIALLAAGLAIPVSGKTPRQSAGPDQPQAWKQLEAELDLLAKEEVADESYLEETRKRLEELKAQDEEQWFSHSSLEATDSLKETHQTETRRMERELGRAEKALNALEKNAGNMAQAEKDRLMQEFDQALEGLRNGAMKPNPELLEQLKGMDLKNLGKLPPEQLQQLKDNLAKHGKCLGECQGGGGNEWDEDLLADGEGQGGCNGNGPGKEGDGEGPGKGGVSRGPGHAGGVLGNQSDPTETGKMEALATKDLSRSVPGDLLELQDGEQEVDRSGSSISAGGSTEATGKGGDRVWKESLDPDEQRALKRFFE